MGSVTATNSCKEEAIISNVEAWVSKAASRDSASPLVSVPAGKAKV